MKTRSIATRIAVVPGVLFLFFSGMCSAINLTLGDSLCAPFSPVMQGAVLSITCVPIATVTPPVCSLSSSQNTISLGSSVTLTATCNPTATSFAWTNTGFGSAVSSGSVSPTATTTYSVVGSNSGGAGNSASVTVSLTSSNDPGGAASPVYRFANSVTGGHFFTANESEKAYILANLPAYVLEGIAYYAYTTQVANTSPVYRFSNSSGFHFFTISEAEKNTLQATNSTYKLDGVSFNASPTLVTETSAVYRFKNSTSGAYFYTTSVSERDYVLAHLPSYVYEAISYYTRTAP